MDGGNELDDAINTALNRTREAQDKVDANLEQGASVWDEAAVVQHRAEDLDELAADAANPAIGLGWLRRRLQGRRQPRDDDAV
jgi:hypothetical protein